MVLKEFNKIPQYIESLNNKERLEFIIKLLPYAVPKYTHKTISDETPELPIFEQIQIVTSVDEKETLFGITKEFYAKYTVQSLIDSLGKVIGESVETVNIQAPELSIKVETK